ncbi:Cdc25b protein [Salpingoeca rosetta]|uniref:M-phase inducer phosphatase n=1 Tax=Salpingoeca rosetta (strain ATCC 50818 / BSB-021) TaxID=946362 RepID=F2U6I6_SALR5|nr:Cdc25b protein [Salpingoeca rosetta]EGD83468.1 Cdc25b protein [Salpingoeca rosetta]|eukprot:XP_004994972.1 Cdc25b protein [Salpingoeca rosetta]
MALHPATSSPALSADPTAMHMHHHHEHMWCAQQQSTKPVHDYPFTINPFRPVSPEDESTSANTGTPPTPHDPCRSNNPNDSHHFFGQAFEHHQHDEYDAASQPEPTDSPQSSQQSIRRTRSISAMSDLEHATQRMCRDEDEEDDDLQSVFAPRLTRTCSDATPASPAMATPRTTTTPSSRTKPKHHRASRRGSATVASVRDAASTSGCTTPPRHASAAPAATPTRRSRRKVARRRSCASPSPRASPISPLHLQTTFDWAMTPPRRLGSTALRERSHSIASGTDFYSTHVDVVQPKRTSSSFNGAGVATRPSTALGWTLLGDAIPEEDTSGRLSPTPDQPSPLMANSPAVLASRNSSPPPTAAQPCVSLSLDETPQQNHSQYRALHSHSHSQQHQHQQLCTNAMDATTTAPAPATTSSSSSTAAHQQHQRRAPLLRSCSDSSAFSCATATESALASFARARRALPTGKQVARTLRMRCDSGSSPALASEAVVRSAASATLATTTSSGHTRTATATVASATTVTATASAGSTGFAEGEASDCHFRSPSQHVVDTTTKENTNPAQLPMNSAGDGGDGHASVNPAGGNTSALEGSNPPRILPCRQNADKPGYIITCDVLNDVLDGKYNHAIDQVYIVDCRFGFEFEGGHIRGAHNLWRRNEVLEFFMHPEAITGRRAHRRTVIVFHCEFSSHRAPSQFEYMRDMDRLINQEHYPHLIYPEMYVLKGGYKAFHEAYPQHCTNSGGYCTMFAERYEQQRRQAQTTLNASVRDARQNKTSVADAYRRQSCGGQPA